MKIKAVYLALALVLLFSLAAVISPAGPAVAASNWYVATTGSDTGGDGSEGNPWGNISYAISQATSGDTIIVAAGMYYENNINTSKSLTLRGAGADITVVDGQKIDRVFYIDHCTFEISNMTIRNGNATFCGGGIYKLYADLTMTNCIIMGNTAESGGGIYNTGDTLTMTGCTISGNHATGNGSGVYNAEGAVTLTNCTISGNTAGDDGGGIFNTYSNALSLTNCTVSGNDAADQGGGIFNADMTMPLKCTIVYDNTASSYQNIYLYYTDIGGESIVDEPLGSAPNPLLGPLQDNGGPTETHALMTGSPAIDACITDCPLPATDQRGRHRPADGDLDGTYFCDIGAYEKQLAVGGTIEPVDRLELLAPWLALAALMAVALSVVVVMRRRRLA